MKNKLSYVLVAVFALAAGSSFAESKCWFWQLDCKAQEALENLDKEGADKGTFETLCRKGVAKEGTFSLRSFEGRGCSLFPEWAAFYLAFCSKILDTKEFEDAHCYKKAIEKLGFDKPEELNEEALKKLQDDSLGVIKDRISEHKGTALGLLKKVVCAVGGDLPVVNLICSTKKEEKEKPISKPTPKEEE